MDISICSTFEEIVNEIVTFTGLPSEEVKYRLWMEALDIGWNVVQDLKRFQVNPHQYDDKMEQLYRESYGFIFETLVFWARPGRQIWTEWAVNRIHLYAEKYNLKPHQVRILMLGDGTGNDSIYLAKNGLKVDYFDVPGSKTFDFAVKRFDYYGLSGQFINILTDYNSCLSGQYDVVVSFEVLEHLPDPSTAIRDIYSMLNTGGIALITEAFGDVGNNVPTHLAVNAKYDGLTPFMFLKHGMLLSWHDCKSYFKPMEFSKLENHSALNFGHLLKDRIIRATYFRSSKRNFEQNFKQMVKQTARSLFVKNKG